MKLVQVEQFQNLGRIQTLYEQIFPIEEQKAFKVFEAPMKANTVKFFEAINQAG